MRFGSRRIGRHLLPLVKAIVKVENAKKELAAQLTPREMAEYQTIRKARITAQRVLDNRVFKPSKKLSRDIHSSRQTLLARERALKGNTEESKLRNGSFNVMTNIPIRPRVNNEGDTSGISFK
ncbi:hypothetical protein AJ79_05323 [Helicocarpus griseus UAMH5409]|uniref:Uncharacterized protein n=1 Tax=Helicocarpus griseus UAMH5409 TaxID=1447875 RepID=A0A2B7XQ12_9EURO|nr:hypothetical protein AJ79_05323 [Helicocarpus griseus UAMH5409]